MHTLKTTPSRPLILLKFSPDAANDNIRAYHKQSFSQRGFDVEVITDNGVCNTPAAMVLVNVTGLTNQAEVDKIVAAAQKQFPRAEEIFAYTTPVQSPGFVGTDMQSEGPQRLIISKDIFETIDRVKIHLGIENTGRVL